MPDLMAGTVAVLYIARDYFEIIVQQVLALIKPECQPYYIILYITTLNSLLSVSAMDLD